MLLGDLLSRASPAHAPKLLISTAEELTDTHRRALQGHFGGARISDFYGSTEFGLIAWRIVSHGQYRRLPPIAVT